MFLNIAISVLFLCFSNMLMANHELKGVDGSKRYQLVVCALFQNESLFLKEWIEYHRLIGVDHFYLYNNLSDDHYKEVLQPYVELGVVDLFECPIKTTSQADYLEQLQLPSYNHGLQLAKENAKWAAFIDLDEFIVPVRHDNLLDMLNEYESCAGLAINWQIFGTSSVKRINNDELVIENLVWKAPIDNGLNAIVKFIVRPECVKSIPNPHAFEFIEGCHAENSQRVPLKAQRMGQPVVIDTVYINHYWFGTEEWFYSQKIPRRQKWGLHVSKAHLDEIIALHNQIEDRTIQRFVPELKVRINESKPYVNGRLMGQLGNQMFQIAAATSLALDHGARACFPDLVTEKDFNIPLNYQNVFYHIDARLPNNDPVFNYLEPKFTYSELPYQPNMSIRGWFQSDKYFKHHKAEIIELFAPHQEIKDYLSSKYEVLISQPKTVSIHFRSYDKEDPEQKVYIKCGREYYLKAIESFDEDSLFVVFSNDIEECKQIFESINRHFVYIEGEVHYYDLYLMSMCKDNIICNSSFSWWGAYLNQNPMKRVIAPLHWFNPAYGADTRDLIPDEWILL